jgi:hypothetical protein
MKTVLPLLLGCVVLQSACVKVKTEPIRVEPIEITMNVNLRIARELNDFFGDLDAESQAMQSPSEQPSIQDK